MVKQAKTKVVVKVAGKKGKRKASKQRVASQVSVLGRALRGLGGLAGSAAGGLVGHPGIGQSVGSNLGAALSRWLGSGDYVVKSNSLARASAVDSIPLMHRNGQSVIVRHREFIGDVQGSINYTIQKVIPLNPGLDISFPWLAMIAQNFQEYTIRGMVFHYIPTAGDAVSSTNNALGSVVVSTNYRSTAAPPTSKMEQLNEYFSNDARPSETFCHPIECDPRENPYNVQYVRSGNVPSGEDPKTYDLGTVYVATAGMQANSITVGELWCTYEVELRKPVSIGLLGNGIPTYLSKSADTGITTGSGLAASLSAAPITSTFTPTFGGDATSFTVNMPVGITGTFLLSLNIYIVSQPSTWLTPTLTNAAFAHTQYNTVTNATSGSWSVHTYCFVVTSTTSAATITFTQTSWISTLYTPRIAITQVAP